MISKQDIERILQVARIEEVIAEFVNLKKSGSSFKGLCPFHTEKTPSFFVNPEKNIFKCFGCGVSGTLITFLMKHENYTYPEALRYLANKYGIEISEEEPDPEDKQIENERQLIYHINQLALQYYELCLWETTEGQTIALSYLRNRQISDHIIRKFSLGFSPLHSKGFVEYAIEKGFRLDDLQKCGLVSGSNDKFRGRIVFPIFSIAGRVLGFGGRIISEKEDLPKYINSPETLIYQKGQILYGLNLAKNQIMRKDNCYVVEGYIDLLRMHQVGIQNVVATLGTSLTNDQIRILKRYTNNVTIIFDGDAAGIKAAMRGIDLLLENDLNTKVVVLPEKDDPDTFLLNNNALDAEKYFELNAENFIYFKTKLLHKESKGDPVKKAALIKDIIQSISKISDVILRTLYIRECSKITGIDEAVLASELANQLRASIISGLPKEHQRIVADAVNKHYQLLDTTDSLKSIECRIAWLMLNFFDRTITFSSSEQEKNQQNVTYNVADYIIQSIECDKLQISHPYVQRIYKFFKMNIQNKLPITLQNLLNENNDDLEFQQFVIKLLTLPYELSENWKKELQVVVTTVQDSEKLLLKEVNDVIIYYKLLHLQLLHEQISEKLKTVDSLEQEKLLLDEIIKIEKAKKHLSKMVSFNRLV